MNIIVDAFGGDNAPLEIIKGCVEAVAEYNINVTLTGDETKIKNVFSENSLSMNNIDIIFDKSADLSVFFADPKIDKSDDVLKDLGVTSPGKK